MSVNGLRIGGQYISSSKPPAWQVNLLAVAFGIFVVLPFALAGWTVIAINCCKRTR